MSIHNNEAGATVKSERYDRQLRMWGQDGQQKLENAKILVLNATATSAEALKNLVLPGIGSFTLVDGKKVTLEDLGNQFFVSHEHVGQSRAAVVTQLLLELNPFVNGAHVEQEPSTWLAENSASLSNYTLVIAANVVEGELLSLAANCATLGVPLVDARSYGLVGQIRLFGGEHVVSDVKPDTPVEDLRMSAPFPELAAFVAKYDLASLNDRDFAHVPYPVLLISQLDAFKAAHGGALPKTTAEKDQFKAALKKLGRAPITEPNIDEALKNAYKAFAPARVPGDVQAVLANPKATEPAGQADDFWWVMAAVKRFVDAEGAGALPLQGGVPDMHSDTATFIALQTVFSAKSDADVAAVARHLQAVCAERSRATLPSEEYVRAMCKGAHYVALSSYRTLADQKTPDATAKAVVVGAIDDAANNISLYLLLRAVDQFHQAHGRFPGVFDDEVAGDIATLKSIVVSLLETYELPGSKIPDELVAEFVRFGATELHNVASIVGGVVAQEVLKLTTSKWTPFNNTFVFNSMNATSNTFAL